MSHRPVPAVEAGPGTALKRSSQPQPTLPSHRVEIATLTPTPKPNNVSVSVELEPDARNASANQNAMQIPKIVGGNLG